jgi:hypothetical protein
MRDAIMRTADYLSISTSVDLIVDDIVGLKPELLSRRTRAARNISPTQMVPAIRMEDGKPAFAVPIVLLLAS